MSTRRSCPTPRKRQFRSKAEAKRFNRQYRSHCKARLWPYLCDTGEHWHLTNQNYDEQKRIGEAINKWLGRCEAQPEV